MLANESDIVIQSGEDCIHMRYVTDNGEPEPVAVQEKEKLLEAHAADLMNDDVQLPFNLSRILKNPNPPCPKPAWPQRAPRTDDEVALSCARDTLARARKTIPCTLLEKVAATGDLMLFTTDQVGSAIIRTASAGKVDHIGMLVRQDYSPREPLGIVEALYGFGVKVWDWHKFDSKPAGAGWHDQYEKLIWRPLFIRGSKEDSTRNRIRDFLQDVYGREYKLDPSKLIQMKSIMGQAADDEDRTFFCSELCAKAYKEAGLLREEVAACSYYPNSFEGDNHLSLFGAELGPEIEVTFTSPQTSGIEVD